MSPGEPVTNWIALPKAGDHNAAQPLWERYFQQLVEVARGELCGAPRRVADEEVALSALASFCGGTLAKATRGGLVRV